MPPSSPAAPGLAVSNGSSSVVPTEGEDCSRAVVVLAAIVVPVDEVGSIINSTGGVVAVERLAGTGGTLVDLVEG